MHADEINVAATEELGKEVYHYHLHAMVLPVVEKKSYGVSVAKMKNCEERLRKLFIKLAIQRNGNRIFH